MKAGWYAYRVRGFFRHSCQACYIKYKKEQQELKSPTGVSKDLDVILRTAALLKKKMVKRHLMVAWTKCPLCGSRLDARLSGPRQHMHLRCINEKCNFHLME